MIVSHRFEVCKASASYTCKCPNCGKMLKRTVTVEHTVNPFNKNDDGEARSRLEVYRRAQGEADAQAASKNGAFEVCRDCEDRPVRELLLSMAADPNEPIQEPEHYWGSPISVLVERKQVERAHADCQCGAPCCARYRFLGYRLTAAGKARAAKLSEQAA